MLTDILISIIPALICITIHELSHGYVAYRLGDNTAKIQGRLTLNPIKHIDIFGLIAMVVFRFGWAKPVPVDMRNFKNPKRGMAITALAGPISNFVLTAVIMFIYGLLYKSLVKSSFGNNVLYVIVTTAYLSTALGIFNLIPIPPLDGSKVLFSLISDRAYYKLMRYERYGMIVLILVLSSGIISDPLRSATSSVLGFLSHIADFASKLV